MLLCRVMMFFFVSACTSGQNNGKILLHVRVYSNFEYYLTHLYHAFITNNLHILDSNENYL